MCSVLGIGLNRVSSGGGVIGGITLESVIEGVSFL